MRSLEREIYGTPFAPQFARFETALLLPRGSALARGVCLRAREKFLALWGGATGLIDSCQEARSCQV